MLYGIILIIIFSLPVLQYIISWYSWNIYFRIMQIFQFEMIIPPWSSKSLIESIWDRNILLSDFSIIEIFLLPIGVYISFKEKYIKKIDMFYIIPIALLSLIILLLIKVGLHFSPCRIIIYLSYLLSILSGSVIIKLLKYVNNKINIMSKDNGNIITFMLIFIPLIIYNSITPLNMDKKSPYNVEQINDASWVSQYVNVSNSIVIAPFNDMNLLMYVGLKPLHSEENNIDKILNFNDIEEMIDFTKEIYPSINMVYLFMSKKYLNKYSNLYTLVPIIINNCKIINKQSAIIIEIPLS